MLAHSIVIAVTIHISRYSVRLIRALHYHRKTYSRKYEEHQILSIDKFCNWHRVVGIDGTCTMLMGYTSGY